MAKNKIDMNTMKETKKDIQKNLKEVNETLVDFSEQMIKETVKTGEAWQKLMAKAMKNSEPVMKKQSDIFYETVKGMKTEAEYSVERFEKLTGVDFSNFRKTIDFKAPKAPKWMKDGFDFVVDQTEEILTEVSKRGEEIADTVKDTAKSFANEAEQMVDKVEDKVKEVIKDVEDRITDIAPKASAASKTESKTAAKAKKAAGKKAPAKTAPAKKAAPKAAKKSTTKKVETKATPKAATKKPTAKKASAPKATATKKAATPKVVTAKADDLKVIEGVGPKLAELLIAGGIKSYADLANAEVKDLQTILDAAGSRYKMYNPTSWPLQARFARDGKMDALKSWQEKNNAQKA